jgi:hypothetical protein
MKPGILCSLVLIVSLSASSGYASILEVEVGPNQFQGFPSPGGDGDGFIAGGGFSLTIEKFFTAFGEIPVILNTQRDMRDGTDTYSVTERIVNNSGLDWTDFHLNVEPIDANMDLVVNFLNPVVNTSNPIVFQQMPGMLWLFGLIPDGTDISISFQLQVTSGGGFDLFGIHEFPTRDGIVPELGSLATWAGLAFVGIGAGPTILRRRRSLRCG